MNMMLKESRGYWGFLIAAIAILASIPFHSPDYLLIIVSYGMIYSIVGLSVNLLLGYGGLVSFGHAAFFTVGAYTVALLSLRLGIYSIDLLIIASMITSLLTALAVGILCIRHTRIYFMILTFALAEVIHAIIHRIFGAAGLAVPVPVSRIKESTLLWFTFQGVNRLEFLRSIYYYYLLAWFIASVVIYWILVNSPVGKSLQAIRDNEERALSVGIPVNRVRLFAFIVSGMFTGIAGALWTPLTGLVDPHMIHWDISGEYVFYALLGGVNSFIGPIVGAFILTSLKDLILSATTYWRFFLGATFVIFVLGFPSGVVGEVKKLLGKYFTPTITMSSQITTLNYLRNILLGGKLHE